MEIFEQAEIRLLELLKESNLDEESLADLCEAFVNAEQGRPIFPVLERELDRAVDARLDVDEVVRAAHALYLGGFMSLELRNKVVRMLDSESEKPMTRHKIDYLRIHL